VAGMLPPGDWSPEDAIDLAQSLQGGAGRP